MGRQSLLERQKREREREREREKEKRITLRSGARR